VVRISLDLLLPHCISLHCLRGKRTQREVAEVARVTEVTVRNRYKELVEKLRLRII